MAQRARLRASDADRDQIAERLREATAEGRLRPDELDQRLGAALTASTYGELDALVADLPSPVRSSRHRSAALTWLPAALVLAIAVPVVALLVLTAVAFVISGLFAGWIVWLFLGWCFFAGRRRGYVSRGRGYRRSGPPRTQTRAGFWL